MLDAHVYMATRQVVRSKQNKTQRIAAASEMESFGTVLKHFLFLPLTRLSRMHSASTLNLDCRPDFLESNQFETHSHYLPRRKRWHLTSSAGPARRHSSPIRSARSTATRKAISALPMSVTSAIDTSSQRSLGTNTWTE